MKHWVMVLVMGTAGVGCATPAHDVQKRWPAHRKEGDARFAELERRAGELEARVKQLETRLAAQPAAAPVQAAPPAPE